MTITKKLTHKLFIAVLIMITMTSSHQLNAMEQKSVRTFNEALLDADFQAYLFLSAIDNNSQFYLFPELVQIIATDVSKRIDKECYDKYGKCLNDPFSLLTFIEDRCRINISQESTIHILKQCLRHSRKSLGEIKLQNKQTVFHLVLSQDRYNNHVLLRTKWIKILCCIAGKDTWDILCMKNIDNNTSLHLSWDSMQLVNALLSAAPNSKKAWDLIITPDKNGYTVLVKTIEKGYFNTAKLLESYRSKEQ